MRYRFLLLVMGFCLLLPTNVAAQEPPQWREQTTNYFAILYPEGYENEATRFANFVDGLYIEVTDILGYQPAPPLTLRIYPTIEIYQQVNPLARVIRGVIAHAHTGRREISIALPLIANASDQDVYNIVRHELTHLIAAELSGGQLSTMWQEGIAQYVEQPAPFLDEKLRYLRDYYQINRLKPWGELDAPGVMYGTPELGYPQSWSMVAFLVDTYGMPTFVEFMRANEFSSGYRGALQQVYGQSSDQLEQAWFAQLDQWMQQGVPEPIAAGANLESLQAALDAGRYSDAQSEAEAILATISDDTTRNQVEILQNQAQRGIEAEIAAQAARSALIAGDYDLAEQEISTARRLFAQLDRSDIITTLDQYTERITAGRAAYMQLEQAQTQLRSFRWGDARQSVERAATTFAELGDVQGQQAANTVLAQINQRIKFVGIGLLILVVLGLAWNIDRRRAARRRSLPLG